ncbi:MAG: hypothetical protein AB1744_07825 [Candidatus Zixiibacteriota bacterium]
MSRLFCAMYYKNNLHPVVRTRVNFLYTNIGRGHPFYLDGILEALVRSGRVSLVRSQSDVFDVSRGLAKIAWQVARWLYHQGSSPGPVSLLYKRLRAGTDYNRTSLSLKLMGRDIRRRFLHDVTPLVVAHPSLVAILREKANLIYQHGELVVPSEALVAGASKVLVPTEAAARAFVGSGFQKKDVIVTGLCIEPALVKQAHDALNLRIQRLQSEEPLTGAFFSSGAEPHEHVMRLVAAAISAVSSGGRVILFAKKGGAFAHYARDKLTAARIEFYPVDSRELLPAEFPAVTIIEYSSRREENSFTAQLFSRFDYFVAPSHERTNWALGLGLPMFIVGPAIGPFAPLNRDLLLAGGAAVDINSVTAAGRFGENLNRLRSSGRLVQMAEAGRGKYEIGGFHAIARFLISSFGG